MQGWNWALKRIKGELSFNPTLVSTRRTREQKKDSFVLQKGCWILGVVSDKGLWRGRMSKDGGGGVNPQICKPVNSRESHSGGTGRHILLC